MKITELHLRAIDMLVQQRFPPLGEKGPTGREIAAAVGVREATLSNWKNDVSFQAAMEQRIAAYRADLESVPYTTRRHRLEARAKLLMAADADAADKNRILDSIEREVEAAEAEEWEEIVGNLRRQLAELRDRLGEARVKVEEA